MRGDRLRLLDALEHANLALEFATAGREAFLENLQLQSAILHRLVLLGESCRALSPELKNARPDVPWRQLIAFRNVLVHQYFGLDLELVWTVVSRDLEPVRASLREILSEHD